MTPYAFAELFIVLEEGGPSVIDLGKSVEAVKLNNDNLAAKGMKPVSPSWFLEKLKLKR